MKNCLLVLLLLFPVLSFAQKQGNVWYFGHQSGLDFSTGVPVLLTNGMTGTDTQFGYQEGTASISDSAGQLLFYTGGKTIWNRNHAVMPNGQGIAGGPSSTMSSLIVPLPGSPTIFYVFTTDEFQSYSAPPAKGYRYSVVDMCLDNRSGDVIAGQKNVLLCDSATEKLAACEDQAGSGYWVLAHKMYSYQFIAWHLEASGITDTVLSTIGLLHGWDPTNHWDDGEAQGQMKINSTGTKAALVIGNHQPALVEIFDFNSSTGVVSNLCHITIDSVDNKSGYGVEFSPDGTKLYVSANGGFGGKRLFQFDLNAGGGNCDSIKASRIRLIESFDNSVMLGMQLGPDGKIYIVSNEYTDLGRINNPDQPGLACNFVPMALTISGFNNMALPPFIAGYKYHNGLASCPSPTGIEATATNAFQLLPNPANEEITIRTETVPETIEVIDMQGKLILLITPSSVTTRITTDLLPEGIYLLRMHSDNTVALQKFSVLH